MTTSDDAPVDASIETDVSRAPHVLVLGLGESGFAMARWCATQGCTLRLTDSREAPPNREAALALPAGAKGAHTFAAAHVEVDASGVTAHRFAPSLLDDGIDLVAISPGLSPLDPSVAALLAEAAARGIPVWGELEFFARALRALRAAGQPSHVIAITGTNGKTTTTAMTGQLVARTGCPVAVAGNISPAMLTRLLDAIDQQALPLVWVLELSSFQLETAYTFEADAATVLNVTQDHLDWHGSMDAYAAAKFRIFGPQTRPVINRGDARGEAWLAQWRSVALDAAREAGLEPRRAATFGLGAPTLAGDFGLVEEGGLTWLAHIVRADGIDDVPPMVGLDPVRGVIVAAASADVADADAADSGDAHDSVAEGNAAALGSTIEVSVEDADAETDALAANDASEANEEADAAEAAPADVVDGKTPRRRRRKAFVEPEGITRLLMPVDALRVRGLHNASNALAALALCRGVGLPLAPLLHGLREYRGEPHRVEVIATLDGVDYVDDSKATNVGATVAALDGLAAPAILIAGGEGKGQDFSPLLPVVARWCKAVMLIGRDAPLLRAAIESSGVALENHPTLQSAVDAAAAQAEAGDVVLLSPACASFDMFRGYAHRAAVFHECVAERAAAQGVML
ncbi:Mur ligase family protein [Robbsia sp. KACC 23696]|uniref:Mur ligase family protein n=1 Tax=Robbsia sp. KACC 23696 TaxID=3149231 RepID=UPI00325AE15D